MIAYLKGLVISKVVDRLVVDVQGVGYEVMIPVSVYERLPDLQQPVQIHIVESMAMYGGGITLYGFLTAEEKEIYLLLREIPGTGSKKAVDYLDKISKSFPDFRRAVIDNDARSLMSLFGFTKKTADKIIVALKDRMADFRPSGREKWATAGLSAGISEALAALVQLGYRESEARSALERLPLEVRSGKDTTVLVREALRSISA